MPNSKPVFKSDAGREAIIAVYDTMLQQWPVPHEELAIPTRCGNTFIVASGDKAARPLFLLHGSSSNSAMWIGDVAEYSKRYRVYAVDVPGEPGKSDAVRPTLKSDAYIDWLDDIFAALGIMSANLLGISLGGWLALKYSIARSERTAKLVLLCPSGVAPAKASFLFRSIFYLSLGKWGIQRMNKILYGKQDIPHEAVDYTNLIINNFNPRIEQIPLFSDEELQKLTMPIMVIVGTLDVVLPSKKTAARFAQLLPETKVVSLPNTGHVILNVRENIAAFLHR